MISESLDIELILLLYLSRPGYLDIILRVLRGVRERAFISEESGYKRTAPLDSYSK